jgi:hypothetical protein
LRKSNEKSLLPSDREIRRRAKEDHKRSSTWTSAAVNGNQVMVKTSKLDFSGGVKGFHPKE